MKAFKSGIIGLVILAGTAMSAFAGQELRQGGHDGGGAGVQLSSEAEVRDAIQWAMEDLRREATDEKSSGPSWLFWAYGGPETKVNSGDIVAVVTCMKMPWVCEDSEQIVYGKADRYDFTWDFLKLSPLEIKGMGEGACPAPDKKDAAASVSAYKFGAKICFSVDILRKTPRDVIRAQVASILAHEMSHLMGHGEEIAESVQRVVYASFAVAATEELQRIRSSIMTEFFFAKADLGMVARGMLGDNADLRVMGYLGSFNGRIFTIFNILPVGHVKEPSLAVKHGNWKQVNEALKAPWQRMNNLQMDIIEGKSSLEQQMEQGNIAMQELIAAEKLVADFLGQTLSQ